MGGVVSAGRDNDELVDNLCKESYIVTPQVERVFRTLDRKDYMNFSNTGEESSLEAYEDHAIKKGNLHLSAPCIYTKVMESLKLEKGLSFLNLGSGTGYLSTMAGLLLGAHGINHGIELYQDNVEFAYEKLNKFKEESPWYDPVEFCEPIFTVGNGLLVSPNGGVLYDRMYCGAACPVEYQQLVKNMLKVGGILITPIQESSLDCVVRTGEREWEHSEILSTVSFYPLVTPSATCPADLAAITMATNVKSLKELSRLAVLSCLTRPQYHMIPSLPLPSPLVNYVSYNRAWQPPTTPLKKLCPMTKEERRALKRPERERGEEEEEMEESDDLFDNLPGGNVFIRSVGRRNVLQVNFNGIMFQVPVVNEESDSDPEPPELPRQRYQRGGDDSDSDDELDDQIMKIAYKSAL